MSPSSDRVAVSSAPQRWVRRAQRRSAPPRQRGAALRAQRGFATVWGIAWVFVCLTMGWLGLMATSIAAAQHHLDGAADLASLSAGARLQRDGDACRTAAEVARLNHVALDSCTVEQQDVVIGVSDVLNLPFGLDGRITSLARAGP